MLPADRGPGWPDHPAEETPGPVRRKRLRGGGQRGNPGVRGPGSAGGAAGDACWTPTKDSYYGI